MPISTDAAETLGLKALAWLAGQEEILPVFMGASGLSQDDLRDRAGEPEFLAAVLDFLLMDDAWIMGFCDSEGLKYDIVAQARAALPGGEQVSWT